jgi:hypothetical protein
MISPAARRGEGRRGCSGGRPGSAVRVERPRVVGVAGVPEVDRAPAGERLTRSAPSGSAARSRTCRRPARPRRGCRRACRRPSGSAAGPRAAGPARRRAPRTSPPAPRRPRARRWHSRRSRSRQRLRALRAQLLVDAALLDAEQAWPGRSPNAARGALGPAHREPHRRGRLLARRRERRAFVEGHHDVRSQQPLDLHRPLRGELVARAVDVAAEGHALLAQLRSSARLITWKPPESVRIGRCQFMKRCSPPSRAIRSAPGRSIR